MKLEVISAVLCPFVQRSIITLKYKKADFKITHIDLKNKPEWFWNISPLGKVPVLRVDDQTTIFESAVINEFVDETIGEPLMPQNPIQRALERAWIQFGAELFGLHYMMTLEQSPHELENKISKLFSDLQKIENIITAEPYFHGKEFSLIDTSWAPLFMRLFLSPVLEQDPRWQTIPKVRKWGLELLKVPAVIDSVVPSFKEIFMDYCRENKSLLY
ncbi:MAG: glutathione S-transferase family protein [Bdellovibrionia bacterium]